MQSNKTLYIIALFSIVFFPGCDHIRSKLGMPTSKELEEIRIELQKDSIQKIRNDDSILLASRLNDSIELQKRFKIIDTVNLNLKSRYYLITGGFKIKENASKQFKSLTKLGFNPLYIDFKSGLRVVYVSQSDTLKNLNPLKERLTDLGISDESIWIYDSKNKLHIEK